MVATLEDSSAAPWLWGAAAAMSLATGTLRIIAEKHYFTDVLAGTALGAASGIVVPLLHRRGSVLAESGGSLSLGPTTIAISGAF
jgi:membrane-associated phospholipid phosphatase